MFELFRTQLKTAYNLDRVVSVDESILLWRGHHSLRRYIPSKAHAWGFKFYALAESSTGYIYDLLVDEGSQARTRPEEVYPGLQKPGRVIMTLMESILDRGHLLGVDNFYTDITLFETLLSRGTHCIGTVRKGRRLLPKQIVNSKWRKVDKGKITALYREDMLLFSWIDKRAVRILSTIGSAELIEQKPQAIHVYNEAMPGVDLGDQKRHGRQVARKRLSKWYTKFFFHIIDIALVNTYCISKHVPELKDMKHSEFRLCLVDMIFRRFGRGRPQAPAQRLNNVTVLSRLTERHCNIAHSEKPRRCVVCSANGMRKRTVYYCVDCDKGLCPAHCFSIYHSQVDISRFRGR